MTTTTNEKFLEQMTAQELCAKYLEVRHQFGETCGYHLSSPPRCEISGSWFTVCAGITPKTTSMRRAGLIGVIDRMQRRIEAQPELDRRGAEQKERTRKFNALHNSAGILQEALTELLLEIDKHWPNADSPISHGVLHKCLDTLAISRGETP